MSKGGGDTTRRQDLSGSTAKRFRLLIFDLGGTLFFEKGPWDALYSQADDALWAALHVAGIPLDAREAYRDFRNLFELYYSLHRGNLDEPTTGVVLNRLLQSRGYHLPKETLRSALTAMFAVTQTNWDIESDAIPTLELLRGQGYRIAAITNASDYDNTQALIDKGKVRPYLEYIVSSAAFGKRKPHPAIFRDVLEHFAVNASQALMIGDDYEADIVGAWEVGMSSIWITRRVRQPVSTRPEVHPVAVISALSQIPGLLEAA